MHNSLRGMNLKTSLHNFQSHQTPIGLAEAVVKPERVSVFSGGIKGGALGENPPSRRLCSPLAPPVRRKKWPKSVIFGKFLDFCPLRIAFCPLDAPHKKFLVPPLSVLYGSLHDDILKIRPTIIYIFMSLKTLMGYDVVGLKVSRMKT